MEPNDLIWAQWPTEVPRPTSEEWAAAEARFNKEAEEAYAKGYTGDGYISLPFTMATYNREGWWSLCSFLIQKRST